MAVATESGSLDARRAARFNIVTSVRYRADEGEWLDGTTANIGRLGLLMRTHVAAPPVSTRLRLRVALKIDATDAGAEVVCSGRVVRVEPAFDAEEVLLAVTIDEFEMLPSASHEDDAPLKRE